MTLARVAATGTPRFAARLFAMVGVAILCTTSLVAAPGRAADPSPPPTASSAQPKPGPTTFSIQPGTKSGPDQRGRFDLNLKPGAKVTDWIVVTNLSPNPATFRVYPADAFNTPNGGFDVLASGLKSRDVGAWTKVEKNEVRLPAGKNAVIRFELQVPANATPGDHVGGILASLTTLQKKADGTNVAVDNRVGTRIYLRVAGPLNPQVAYSVSKAQYRGQSWNPLSGGHVDLTFTVRNTGNVRLTGRHLARITGLLQPASARQVETLPELLPGNEIQLSSRIDDVRPLFRLTANTTFTPTAATNDSIPASAESTGKVGVWAMSWPLNIAVLLLLALAVFMIVRLVRRLRLRTSPPPAVPVASSPEPAKL